MSFAVIVAASLAGGVAGVVAAHALARASIHADEARTKMAVGLLQDAFEAVLRAEGNMHSPWCNGVHSESGLCEGDYLMGRFIDELKFGIRQLAPNASLPP